jgi:hypothetical protein
MRGARMISPLPGFLMTHTISGRAIFGLGLIAPSRLGTSEEFRRIEIETPPMLGVKLPENQKRLHKGTTRFRSG